MTHDHSITKENEILRKQLRLHIDLGGNGEVTLATPYHDLPEADTADIQVLTQYPQWIAFRRWYLMNAKSLYEQSASSGKEEAYIMSRMAKCLIDMIESAERIEPDKSQPIRPDPYDLAESQRNASPGGSLPLAE